MFNYIHSQLGVKVMCWLFKWINIERGSEITKKSNLKVHKIVQYNTFTIPTKDEYDKAIMITRLCDWPATAQLHFSAPQKLSTIT